MIIAPAWTLGAALVAVGTLLMAMYCVTDEERNADAADVSLAAFLSGMAIAIVGMRTVWISPNPEPEGAWITIGLTLMITAIARIAGATSTRNGRCFVWTAASSCILIAATLIVRASIHQFD